ncbi:MAG: PD-(D/E)XK nuclease family protein, partial [Candidatus Acidiferrales bacterium]
ELYYDSMREHKLDRGLSIELALLAWQECNMDASEKTFPSSFEKFGGKSGAYNLIANYFDQTYQFESQHWTIVASEAGFGLNREVLITGASDVMVYWLGRPDLIIIENDRLIPLDHKTVDRIESRQAAKYKPHPQTAGYIIAAQSIADSLGIKTEVDRCLINAVARSEPTEHPKDGKPRSRFMKIPISYSQDELTEWAEQILGKARRLRYSIEHNEWLRNETQCHIYSGCSFRPVCSVPRGSRELILKSNYTKIEAWAPYRPAED